MSHYPSPYQPPTPQFYGYGQPPDLLKPARRAGLLMIILGVLTLLMAGCLGGMGAMIGRVDLPPDVQAQFALVESQTGANISMVLGAMAVVIMIPGLLMIGLGVFVRRGGRMAAILGAVLTGLILIYLVIAALSAIGQLINGNFDNGVAQLLFNAITIGLFGLQMVWLIKAAMNARSLNAFNQQQQAYLWHMQQQMQAQQQQYRYPPPPPPPAG